MIKKTVLIVSILVLLFISYKGIKKINFNTQYEIGERIDSLNNVIVFYNGGVDNVVQRNTKDGYNLGLEYQCVEFVKRYYYEHYDHKMPDSYGHAISFYQKGIADGQLNAQRNLLQFANPSKSRPVVGDLLVMNGTLFNRYGHVAIISKVTDRKVEIIQQNPGPYSSSRELFELIKVDGRWFIDSNRILGWLRK